MFDVRQTSAALQRTSPALRSAARGSAARDPRLSAAIVMLLYVSIAFGAAAFLFLRLSTAFGDPHIAGLLTSLAAITLLPFLGLGEDRAS
jgi:hypothetical protein